MALLPPDPQLVANMGRLIGETVEKGMFHNAAGLKRSAERIRLRWTSGQRELTRGPLSGHDELVAGLARLQVKSLDEAVAWTTRIAERVDGPFAESKEMIAGFTIIDVPSLADVKAWPTCYADILGDTEVDVREVFS